MATNFAETAQARAEPGDAETTVAEIVTAETGDVATAPRLRRADIAALMGARVSASFARG